jgi:hypothetical protein
MRRSYIEPRQRPEPLELLERQVSNFQVELAQREDGQTDELLDAISSGRIYRGMPRKQKQHATNQCSRTSCERRAATTFTYRSMNEDGEQLEKREQLCWQHYRERRDGVSASKREPRRVSKAPQLEPQDLTPELLAAIQAVGKRSR